MSFECPKCKQLSGHSSDFFHIAAFDTENLFSVFTYWGRNLSEYSVLSLYTNYTLEIIFLDNRMLQSWFDVVALQFSGQSSKFITERQAMGLQNGAKIFIKLH